MVQQLARMAAKILPTSFLKGTLVEPQIDSMGEDVNDVQVPGYEDLKALRDGHMDYVTWLMSAYAYEMQRRKAYYEMTQVETDAAALAGLDESYITPSDWDAAHSGPGWSDLRAMLPDAMQETCVKPVMTNLCQVIIDNRQVVYDTQAESREVIVDGKVDEKATADLKIVYDACAHDLASKQLCKWTGLFSTSFQCITYDEYEDRIVKTNLEPYKVYVIDTPAARGNLQHPETLVAIAQDLEDVTEIEPEDENLVTWQVWWRDMWWYETTEGIPFKDIDLTESGFNLNPFRDNKGRPVKPILVTHDSPTVTRIHEPGSDILVNQNQVIDRMLTAAAHTIEYQNFAVPVITGAEIEEVESQPYSPGAPQVYRNPDTNFTFAHPAAPIGETIGADTRIMRTFARLHSIDPEMVDPETKVQSGVSRMQARTALVERRNQEFPKWLIYERESWWLTAIVWNAFHDSNKILVPDRFPVPGAKQYEILVQFGEDDLSVDPLTDATVIKMYIENDLLTRPEAIALNRRIPLKRAEMLHEKIKARNEKDKPEPEESLMKATTPRIGQSGNRPMTDERDKSKTGGNTTSGTGNISIRS